MSEKQYTQTKKDLPKRDEELPWFTNHPSYYPTDIGVYQSTITKVIRRKWSLQIKCWCWFYQMKSRLNGGWSMDLTMISQVEHEVKHGNTRWTTETLGVNQWIAWVSHVCQNMFWWKCKMIRIHTLPVTLVECGVVVWLWCPMQWEIQRMNGDGIKYD